MTDAEKIAGAAELIQQSAAQRGEFISPFDATKLAKQLYELWTERVQVLNLKPGDIAQHFRERYNERDNPYTPDASESPTA